MEDGQIQLDERENDRFEQASKLCPVAKGGLPVASLKKKEILPI